MSVHFHKLTVAAVDRETPDCVSITFNIPDDLKKIFQYYFISLMEKKVLKIKDIYPIQNF